MMIIMSTGWDYVSELWPPTGLLSSPRWYTSMENHGAMISKGENSWSDHQNSPTILPAESTSSKAGGIGEGSNEFCLAKYLFHTWKGSLTCCKILRHGGERIYFPSEWRRAMGVYRLKNPSPSAGFEPAKLRSNGTLTTRPPRITVQRILQWQHLLTRWTNLFLLIAY
jgi:hypothetical protein